MARYRQRARSSPAAAGGICGFAIAGRIHRPLAGIGPGIDTRGDGGFIIAPPSIHPNGQHYEFLSDDDLAAAPEWLERLARKKISERALENMPRPNIAHVRHLPLTSNAYGQAALDAEIASLAATLPGTRNQRP